MRKIKPKALSIEELHYVAIETDEPVVVEIFKKQALRPAILDFSDRTGVIAVWCASTQEEDWLFEKNYGKTWIAYPYE